VLYGDVPSHKPGAQPARTRATHYTCDPSRPHRAGCLSEACASSSGEGTPSSAWTHFGFPDSGADSGPLGASGAASPALPCSPRRAASFEVYGRTASPLGFPRAASAAVPRFSVPTSGGHMAPLPAGGAPARGATGPLTGGLPPPGVLSPFTAASGIGFGLDSGAFAAGGGVAPGSAPESAAALASPFGSPPGGAPIDVDAFAAAILDMPCDDDGGDDSLACAGWLQAAAPPQAGLASLAPSSASLAAGTGFDPLTPAPASASRARPSPPAAAAAAAAAALGGLAAPPAGARPDMLRCQSLEAALARSSLAHGEAAAAKPILAGLAVPGAGCLGGSLGGALGGSLGGSLVGSLAGSQSGSLGRPLGASLGHAASSSSPGVSAARGGGRGRGVGDLLRPEPGGVAKPSLSPRCGRLSTRVRRPVGLSALWLRLRRCLCDAAWL